MGRAGQVARPRGLAISSRRHAGTIHQRPQAPRRHRRRLDVGPVQRRVPAPDRLGLRRLRALRRRTGRPRRRHHHPSGIAGCAGSKRRRHARARHRGAQADRARPPGPRHRRAAAAADPDLVGPAAAPAARHHRSGALPSRLGFRARRAGRQRRARALQRRPRRARRHPGRRRRHPLERARTGRAGTAADLRRLLHLARRAERGRSRAADAAGDFPVLRVLSAAAAGGHHLSDRRLQRRSAAGPPPLQFHLVSRRRRRSR